jgi:DNA topoisomerase-1
MVLNIEKTENKNRQIDNTKCPECGEELVEKSGRYGKFMGCKGYPRCKYTRPVRNA